MPHSFVSYGPSFPQFPLEAFEVGVSFPYRSCEAGLFIGIVKFLASWMNVAGKEGELAEGGDC